MAKKEFDQTTLYELKKVKDALKKALLEKKAELKIDYKGKTYTVLHASRKTAGKIQIAIPDRGDNPPELTDTIKAAYTAAQKSRYDDTVTWEGIRIPDIYFPAEGKKGTGTGTGSGSKKAGAPSAPAKWASITMYEIDLERLAQDQEYEDDVILRFSSLLKGAATRYISGMEEVKNFAESVRLCKEKAAALKAAGLSGEPLIKALTSESFGFARAVAEAAAEEE